MIAANLNNVKSYIGKHVNIHLKDGSVLINVKVLDTTTENSHKALRYSFKTKLSKHAKLRTLKLSAIEYLLPTTGAGWFL